MLENTKETYLVEMKGKGSGLFWFVLIFFLLSVGSLPFVFVDVTIQTSGIVTSLNDNVTITSPVTAQVERCFVKENSLVSKGDTLLVFNADILDLQVIKLKEDLYDIEKRIADLNMLINDQNQVRIDYYFNDYNQFLSQKKELEQSKNYFEREYNVALHLYNERVISQTDFEKKKYDFEVAKSKLNSFIERKNAQWKKDKFDFGRDLEDLEYSLSKLKEEKKHYSLLSPITGYISKFQGIRRNAFLTSGSKISDIVPTDSLIVESYVQPKDIGLLNSGQKVKYQIHAFNYNEWGLAEGVIFEIYNNVVMIEGKPYFKVRSLLAEQYLKLKNGFEGYIIKDMTLTSQFYIARRSIWNLLFDTIEDWLNPKKIKESKAETEKPEMSRYNLNNAYS